MNLIKTIPFFLIVFLVSAAYAQEKVKEKDIIGSWKLDIQLEEEFEKAEDELDDEENLLGKIVLQSVSGLVTGIMDEIDIYMEFQKDGTVTVTVDAFDEKEVEYAQWYIDDEGRLFITDTDSFQSDDEDFWMMDNHILVYFDENLERQSIYLVNID